MTRSITLLALALALVTATGCEADDSAPNHSARNGIFNGNTTEQNNAEKRALEAPQRQLPTGSGGEFPGQSRLDTPATDTSILFADAAADNTAAVTPANTPPVTSAPAVMAPSTSTSTSPVISSSQPTSAPIAPSDATSAPSTLAAAPAAFAPPAPAEHMPAGYVAVPDTGYAIDKSWGTEEPLKDYPHRPNPATTTVYYSGLVLHNPLYYYDVKIPSPANNDHSTFGPSSGANAEMGAWQSFGKSAPTDYARVAADYVWFNANVLINPVLWFKDCPIGQRQSWDKSENPNFHNFLPPTGELAYPTTPGKVEWQYPVSVSPYGTSSTPATQPSGSTTSQTQQPDPFAAPPATQP